MRTFLATALSAIVFMWSADARAQRIEDPDEDLAASAPGLKRVTDIAREVQKLGDWKEQYDLLEPGIDRYWAKKGWNDEADIFAREVFREVAAIPPWEITTRVNHLTEAIRDRYAMSEAQFNELQMRTYGMIGTLALRHGGTILRQTKEAVGVRLKGEPFSQEQVARWATESEDLVRQSRRQFERMAEKMAESFTPDQRAILERDMSSYRRRAADLNEMRARWMKGEWQPEDWGLENDPIHRPMIESRADAGAAVGPESLKSQAVTLEPLALEIRHDESAWGRYVREFIARYGLDEGQAQAALSILRELEARAADYRRLHREELASVPREKLDSSELHEPIRRLFNELEQRLRPIPTDAQRRRAERPGQEQP